MSEVEKVTGHIALLVVHGVGAQERGETLGKLLKGLRRVDQDSVPTEIHDGVLATVCGQRVQFYEVYWADLLKGDITRGAFQMNEFQSLAWFPLFNRRRGNYRPGSYSFLKLAWWCVALPIMNFFVLFAHRGAGLFARIWSSTAGKRKEMDTVSTMWGPATLTMVDEFLDEYVGDVFSYVNSAGNAFHLEKGRSACPPEREHVYTRIVQRFYDQLVKADADGCTTIQIVAHSLGTVVTYHALSGFRFEPDRRDDAEDIRAAIAKVRRVYTIGCPLEKIRFFWPRLAPSSAPFGNMKIHWENFASWFDPLAGTLRNFDDWGKVSNRRLLGGGFIRAHVVYEHSPVFLGALARGLCGHNVPFKAGLWERLRGWLLLIGETLLAPTALAVVLVVGAALFGIVVSIIPWILARTLPWFLPEETWMPIVVTALLINLGAVFLASLAAPVIRARKVHSLYWAATPSPKPPGAS
jgi:hypothetical protein